MTGAWEPTIGNILMDMAKGNKIACEVVEGKARYTLIPAQHPVAAQLVEELLDRDLIVPAKDGLFDGMSQTYRIKQQ